MEKRFSFPLTPAIPAIVLLLSLLLPASASLAAKQIIRPAAEETKSFAEAYYYFTAAQILKSSGDVEGAITLYKKAIEIDPGSALLLTDIGTLFIHKGDYDSAKTHLEKAVEIDPEYAEAHQVLAELYLVLKDEKAAVRSYNKAIALEPSNDRHYLLLATLYTRTQDYDMAIDTLKRLLDVNPGSVMAYYYSAKIEFERSHYGKSEEYYRKALEQSPHFTTVYLELGATYEIDGKTGEAADLYMKALDMMPRNTAVRKRLGTLLIRQNKLEEATKQFSELEKYPETRLDALIRVGLIKFELKDYDTAIVKFNEALEMNPELPRVHYYLATAYEEAGQEEKATGEFQKIPTTDNSYLDSKVHLAYIYERQGRIDDAINELKDAISMKGDPDLYRLLATVLKNAGRAQEAIDVMLDAIKVKPDDTSLIFSLGVLYDEADMDEKMYDAMAKVIELDPKHADALNYLGYSWAEKGLHLDQAEDYIKKALAIKPESGHILDSLGWVYYQKGEYAKAIVELEKALKYLPGDPLVMEHLGDAYWKKSSKKKAISTYESAVELAPENTALKQKLIKLKKELRTR